MRIRRLPAAALVLAMATLTACATAAPSSSPPAPTPATTAAPSAPGATTPAASIVPSATPGFAFDPESIVGYYQSIGYTCTEPQPSVQAAGYAYRSCQLVDPEGRTRTLGLVTDAGDNVADAFMRIRGKAGEEILDPAAVLEPFAAFLGSALGEVHGSEALDWVAAHLGDTDARTTIGELVIATYTASPEDHSILAVEIANQAYLQAPRPSPSPTR